MTVFSRIASAASLSAIAALAIIGPRAALARGGAPSEASAVSRVVIDQVEVTGVRALSSEAISSVIEVVPGEPLAYSKVEKSTVALKSLYRSRGYDEVGIRTRLFRRVEAGGHPEVVLEFQVSEGRPTRVAEVDFVSDGSVNDVTPYEVWRKLVGGMRSRIGLQSGDVMDQEKLGSGRRAVLEYLASEEYVSATADDVREIPRPAPAGATAIAGKWVKLEIHLRLGDRISFGFRGNTVFTEGHLRELVNEQRVEGLGNDYIGAIESRIRKEYRSLGYAQVSIEAYSFRKPRSDETHVTLAISEGRRFRLRSLEFQGNLMFTSNELRDRFFSKASVELQHGYYVEDDVQKASDLLIEWMKSRGYLGARLVTIKPTFLNGAGDERHNPGVTVQIYLVEGERTIVQDITFTGLGLLKPDAAAEILKVRKGQPLDLFAFNEGIEAFKAYYRNQGYLSVSIQNEGSPSVVTYSDDNRLADIHLDLSEGPRFRVSQIRVEGLEKTRKEVVLRAIELHPGDVVGESRLIGSEADLRKLGIFSTARVKAIDDPDHPGDKIITVSVTEADAGVLAGGPGFRNDLGIRAFGEVGYTNLWGEGHGIFLDAAVNRRLNDANVFGQFQIPYRFVEYQTQISYNWTWFAGSDITFRPTLNQSGTEYLTFDAITTQLALNWEKVLLKNPNLTGLLTYSLQRVDQFNAIAAQDDGPIRIGSITPALRLDMRDNPLAPTRGFYGMSSFEWADPALGSQRGADPVGYVRFQLRTDYTIPVTSDISWYLSFRSGYEKSTVAQAGTNVGAIPLIEQFALGGIGSLRGWNEQELNYQTTNVLGSLSYVNYRTQVDMPIAGQLRFGPFLDAANLLLDHFSFSDQMNFGTGVGFHYLTPVGPVNLDYGNKLGPVPGSQIYFSIGVI